MILSAKVAVLEIAEDEVRLAVVRTGRSAPVLLEAQRAAVAFGGPEEKVPALAAAVRDVVGRLKSKPSVFVLSGPSELSVVRPLTLPFRGLQRVAAAVPFELEPYLALPLDELVVDFTTMGESEGQTEVLAVGMNRKPLEELLGVLDAAEVSVDCVGNDAAGLAALWQQRLGRTSGLKAALHVCGRGSVLTILHNNNLAYYRWLSRAAEQFREDPGQAAREAQNSIRGFLAGWHGDGTVEGLTVTGVSLGSAEAGRFEEGLRLPVEFVDLLDGIKGTDRIGAEGGGVAPLDEEGNAWGALLGVALGAAGSPVALDFRVGDSGQQGLKRSLVAHGVFTGCLALLVMLGYGAYCFVDYRENVAGIERAGHEAWRLFEEAFPDSAHVRGGRPQHDVAGFQTYDAMKTEMDKREGSRSAPLRAEFFTQATLLDLLVDLSGRMPNSQVKINEIKITSGTAGRVTILGEVEDDAAFSDAFAALKESSLLRVDQEPKRERQQGGKTAFTIVAERAER